MFRAHASLILTIYTLLVVRADMLFEIVAPSKSLSTQRALKRFVASMLSHVALQVFNALECELAFVAGQCESRFLLAWH
jgi:hypothetical protein